MMREGTVRLSLPPLRLEPREDPFGSSALGEPKGGGEIPLRPAAGIEHFP